MLLQKQISYKFLDDRSPVYVLKQRGSLYNTPIYTIPFSTVNRPEVRNVLCAYQNPLFLENIREEVKERWDCSVESVPLHLIKEVSFRLQMPLVVIVNEYMNISDRSHHSDVFFYDPLS